MVRARDYWGNVGCVASDVAPHLIAMDSFRNGLRHVCLLAEGRGWCGEATSPGFLAEFQIAAWRILFLFARPSKRSVMVLARQHTKGLCELHATVLAVNCRCLLHSRFDIDIAKRRRCLQLYEKLSNGSGTVIEATQEGSLKSHENRDLFFA